VGHLLRSRQAKDADATKRGADCGKLLVVLVLLEIESKPAPLNGTRVRHPAETASGAGKDAGATKGGADCEILVVVLVVLEVGSKPAPLNGTRVRHPAKK
jgi:hypothetical protein